MKDCWRTQSESRQQLDGLRVRLSEPVSMQRLAVMGNLVVIELIMIGDARDRAREKVAHLRYSHHQGHTG